MEEESADIDDTSRCGLPGNKGLKIETIPGGLYKVRNLGGGEPPNRMKGLWTEKRWLYAEVTEYNKKLTK